jgi:hypothetical protein
MTASVSMPLLSSKVLKEHGISFIVGEGSMRFTSNVMRFDLILDNPVGDKLSNISTN